MRSSKSTLWASKSGPSTHANLMPSPILTRQPPHIPVPSTITGLRLTTVGMPRGRVASAHAFIMIGGPMASTSSMSGCAASACSMPFVTRPLMPAEPSSVQTMSSSQTERNLSSQNMTPRLRKPRTPITCAPLLAYARACGKTGATPRPPPTHRTFFAAADVARDAHRAHDRVEARADPAVPLHFPRRLADGLDHQRDRARVRVEIRERQRNALALLVLHHDDELAGLRRLRHRRMADLQHVRDVRVVLAVDDLEVGHRVSLLLATRRTARRWQTMLRPCLGGVTDGVASTLICINR